MADVGENLYKDRERGQAAEQIIKHPLWDEVWATYKQRIFLLLEQAAGTPNQPLKDLLLARLSVCNGIRSDVERIMTDGKFAAESLEFEEKRKGLHAVSRL